MLFFTYIFVFLVILFCLSLFFHLFFCCCIVLRRIKLNIYYRFDPILSDGSRDVARATNFRVKMGELGQLIFILRLGIPKRNRISQFRFQQFIYDDLATLYKHLVNFVSVTPELKKGKMCTPRRSVVWQRGSNARPCGDQY